MTNIYQPCSVNSGPSLITILEKIPYLTCYSFADWLIHRIHLKTYIHLIRQLYTSEPTNKQESHAFT